MAVLVFQKGAAFSAIEFDCTVSEVHHSKATATEHPIEKGAHITDHYRKRLDGVSVQGMITNTPLNASAILHTIKGSIEPAWTVAPAVGTVAPLILNTQASVRERGASVRGGQPPWIQPPIVKIQPERPRVTRALQSSRYISTSMQTMQFVSEVDRVRAVYQALVGIMDEGVTVRLITDLREYPEMFLLDMSAPRMAEDALKFSMELRDAKFVSTETVQVRRTKTTTAEKRAQVPAPEGNATPHQFSDENAAAADRSVAARSVDATVDGVPWSE